MGGNFKLFEKLDENTDMNVVKDEWMKHFREEHAKREAAEAGSGDHWLRDMMFTFKSGCDRTVAEQEKAKAASEAASSVDLGAPPEPAVATLGVPVEDFVDDHRGLVAFVTELVKGVETWVQAKGLQVEMQAELAGLDATLSQAQNEEERARFIEQQMGFEAAHGTGPIEIEPWIGYWRKCYEEREAQKAGKGLKWHRNLLRILREALGEATQEVEPSPASMNRIQPQSCDARSIQRSSPRNRRCSKWWRRRISSW